MTLRISYRTILRNVHEKIVAPSIESFRDATREEKILPDRSDKHAQKVKELEEKIAKISTDRSKQEVSKKPTFIREKDLEEKKS